MTTCDFSKYDTPKFIFCWRFLTMMTMMMMMMMIMIIVIIVAVVVYDQQMILAKILKMCQMNPMILA